MQTIIVAHLIYKSSIPYWGSIYQCPVTIYTCTITTHTAHEQDFTCTKTLYFILPCIDLQFIGGNIVSVEFIQPVSGDYNSLILSL